MTDKKKITLIYVGVAVISLFILAMGYFLASLRSMKERPTAENVGKEEITAITVLSRDLEVQKQDGAMVKISDLKDKVWIAAQFYAACPMCAERNANRLLGLYAEFKNEPEFQVVCLSVDPEQDKIEHLQAVESQLEVDGRNWWFVKTEKDTIWDYMRNVMLFGDIRERTQPEEIAAKGKWSHDLGLQVWRGDTMVARWDEGRDLQLLKNKITTAIAELRSNE